MLIAKMMISKYDSGRSRTTVFLSKLQTCDTSGIREQIP